MRTAYAYTLHFVICVTKACGVVKPEKNAADLPRVVYYIAGCAWDVADYCLVFSEERVEQCRFAGIRPSGYRVPERPL